MSNNFITDDTGAVHQLSGAGTSPTSLILTRLGEAIGMREAPKSTWSRATWGLTVLLSAGIMLWFSYWMMLLPLYRFLRFGTPSIAAYAGIGLLAWLAWPLVNLLRPPRSRQTEGPRPLHEANHIREDLADDLCPCCAYDLTPIPPSSDLNGQPLTTCPECGAAWLISYWKQDHRDLDWTTDGTPERDGRARKTTDARGRQIPVLVRRGSRRLMSERAPLLRPDRGPRLLLDGCVLAFILTAAGIMIAFEPKALYISFIIVPILTLVYAIYRLSWAERAGNQRLIAHKTAEGICACCETTLNPTPSPIDSCLLCDACGAAWASPPKTR